MQETPPRALESELHGQRIVIREPRDDEYQLVIAGISANTLSRQGVEISEGQQLAVDRLVARLCGIAVERSAETPADALVLHELSLTERVALATVAFRLVSEKLGDLPLVLSETGTLVGTTPSATSEPSSDSSTDRPTTSPSGAEPCDSEKPSGDSTGSPTP